MSNDREKQEISVLGRLFGLEGVLFLMGLFSLCSGVYTGVATQIFFGVSIIGGSIALFFVRKKDWKKHWEEQEYLHQQREERRRHRKEEDDVN